MRSAGVLVGLLAAAGALLAPPPPLTTISHDGVLELQLCRPDALNALSSETVAALDAGFARAAGDDAVRAVLLTAAPGGRAFCAGGDIKAVAAAVAEYGAPAARDFLEREYSMLLRARRLAERKPVVAMADGIAFGAGAGLFASCSHRALSARSTIAMPEVAIALVPDAGATRFLAPASLAPEFRAWGAAAALAGARVGAWA